MSSKPRRVSRELDCKLTDPEKLRLGSQLAAAQTEIELHRDGQKKLAALIRPLQKQSKELVGKLETGVEKRTVFCEVHEGPGANVRIVRTDSGDVVEERPMTAAEAQGDWLEQTEAAVERGKGKRSKPAQDDGDEDDFADDEGNASNVTHLPFGAGRSSSKKAARTPRKVPKKKR